MHVGAPYILFAILILTLVLLIWGRWRFDIVTSLALGLCLVFGIVPFNEAFSGFSNPAVSTVACIMVISEAIIASGIIDMMVSKLMPYTKNIMIHITILTVTVAILSAFMNNVGAMALLMPVAIQSAYKNNRSPSLILMPLAFGSALGGMTTLIGTPPNILVSNYRFEVTGNYYQMFDFAPVGSIILVVGVLFLALIGWRMLPERKKSGQSTEQYQVKDYITEVEITEKSTVMDMTLTEFENLVEGDFTVLGLIRGKRKRLVVQPNEILQMNDILILEASHSDLLNIIETGKLKLVTEEITPEILQSDSITLMEAVVPMGSRILGRSLYRMKVRSRFNINVLAIARNGKPITERLNHVSFDAGDVILIQGNKENIDDAIYRLGLLPLISRGVQVGMRRRKWLPLTIFMGAIGLVVSQILPIQIAFGLAVLLMLLLNVIPLHRVYDSIEWPVIVLLGTMIPVGNALQTTGGTELISHAILHFSGHVGPMVLLGAVMLITMILSGFLNNAATAVVMAPIAFGIAQALNVNIDPFLMAVVVGASCSFITPIGHQNNTLVMGPGGYKFMDYFKIGVIFELIILAVGLPAIVWVWPL